MKSAAFSICGVFMAAFSLLVGSEGFAQGQAVKGPQPVSFNTEAEEDHPHPVPMKGQLGSYRLYFSRSKDGNPESKIDLHAATWSKAKKEWANTELVGPQVESKGNDASCFVTPYGAYPQTIWFASTKDPSNKKFDIFGAVRDLPPTNSGEHRVFAGVRALATIDTPGDETHPWLGKDLKTLYFTKETKEGLRVAVTTRKTVDGPRGFEGASVIEELDPGYFHATVSPDATVMYLQGPREGGGTALFRSKRDGGKWSVPTPLKSLNHPEGKWDGSPNLSRDGLILYFSSDRPNGKGGKDIYSIPVSAIRE